MKNRLDDHVLDQLFREARSYPAWEEQKVSDNTLHELYELAIMGPTSMNCLPARFVFIRTPDGKEKLLPAVAEGNIAKVEQAPVTIIIAHDMHFHDALPELWPHTPDAGKMFEDNSALLTSTAFATEHCKALT